ncbi:MAG: FkbM family methyltransferase [Phycisphaeraceae bacterium]
MRVRKLIDRYFIKQPRLRRFVTAALEPNRDVDINLSGANLRINTRREHGYLRASRLVRKNSTLSDECSTIMNLFAMIRDGDTFVDVGANVGLFTHSLSRLANLYPNFSQVAIEAHPDTYARLSARESDRIAYFNLAMGDKEGEHVFVDGAVSHVFTAVEKQNAYNIATETITVKMQRLDRLDLEGDSLVVKIDVEGQEMNVLKGAEGLFADGRVSVVYLDGYDDPAINDLLLGHGFKLFSGRNLKPIQGKTFSLLAIHPRRLPASS